jgi:N-acetylneuraminic acid mutarotase
MPDPRFLFAAVAGTDGKIYVFGGIAEFPQSDNPRILNSIDVYDPETNIWSTRGSMPTTLCGHAAALGADGKIYLLGGGTEYRNSPLRDVRCYDPVNGIWKMAPGMNRHRDSFSAVATPDGKIYAIGGTDVGAYGMRQRINVFLPQKHRLYEGKVQNTAEVWNIFE